MFGLDDLPHFVLGRHDARPRDRGRDPARPPPRHRPRPPRRRDDAARLDRAAAPATRPSSGSRGALGHALTLFALGVPIVLYQRLSARDRAARRGDGDRFLIVGLAVWLLVRWRRGAFHAHPHDHGDRSHAHLHSHSTAPHEHATKQDAASGPSASGSCTGSAAARVSGSSSSARSTAWRSRSLALGIFAASPRSR